MPEKLRIAITCSSNMNRSMEAHSVLSKKGYYVKSFGTGDKVKLPGTAIDKPNVYDFSCTYDEIYNDLTKKDKAFYTQNGLLHMLDRNRRIKLKPEKFQHSEDQFDLIITCEERVYDQVIDYFNSKTPTDNTPVHIINVDIQDNQEEATIGAFFICELVQLGHLTGIKQLTRDEKYFFGTFKRHVSLQKLIIRSIRLCLNNFTTVIKILDAEYNGRMVSKCEDLDNDLVRLLPEYEKKCNRSLLHCMLFY